MSRINKIASKPRTAAAGGALVAIKKKMKHRLILTIILFSMVVLSKTNAQTYDTLLLSEYLTLFNEKFTTDFDIGWTNSINDKPFNFTFNVNKELYRLCIKLDNGTIFRPEIYGLAYSYKQISNHLFWLTYYREEEVGFSFLLSVLDIENRSLSNPYVLAHAGGDGGDWGYRYGNFINDSTYSYLKVNGTEFETLDSISGQDRIKINGEVIELGKIKLIKCN